MIFADEKQFRAHKPVDLEVQAYYHVVSNRIYLYETSEADEDAPDVAARRKPQTVAHEGAHQILQNIGVHPRLAPWPLWLVEGLAEYFAPTTRTRDGQWHGANRINPFHMATLRDLSDPLAIQLQKQGLATPRIGRDPSTPMVEYLVTREDLTPTDYALAWALTYYLANERFEDFVTYLNQMAAMDPLSERTPQEQLDAFRATFGDDLAKLGKSIDKSLKGLKHFEKLPYYAVTFEQPLGNSLVRRGALVSQSPAMIRQWLEEIRSPQSGQVFWHAQSFETRTRAHFATERWINSR